MERTFPIETRYLNLPIKNGAPKRRVTLLFEGNPVVTNEIELAEESAPDWWAGLEVRTWQGKSLTLRVDGLPAGSAALAAVTPSDSLQGEEPLYHEALRPQLHFSAQRGWLNDPNGLVFYNGEYHLFFQHNPYGWGWGNMHWGHATSPDLVHWQEHGDVLAPDALGAMFSGSAVVDWHNTSGFGTDTKPPLVLIYTAAGNPTTQCLAFSTNGRTFTKFNGNPVLPELTPGNRDPKVFWYEPTQRWIMVLYVGLPEKRHTVHFFTSPNLRDWTLASITHGGTDTDTFLYECPDFFELPVDGDTSQRKWVLTAANSEYAIGTFDGTTFTPETIKLPDVHGQGFYAAQTFSDLPEGERVQIGWCQAPSPGMPFNQLQSLPCVLTLRSTPNGPRLARTPVAALESLRAAPNQAGALAHFQAECLELRAELLVGQSVTFQVRGARIAYDAQKQVLSVNEHQVSAPLIQGKQRLIVFVDRTLIEVFASDGLVYCTLPFIPKREDLSVVVSGSAVENIALQVYPLKSLWEPNSL